MEKDNSPDILLPSNGGYNPKIKSIFELTDKTAKAQPPEMPDVAVQSSARSGAGAVAGTVAQQQMPGGVQLQ